MNDSDQLQQKYLEMHTLEQQLKQFQQHQEALNQQILELVKLKNSLDDLDTIKENTPSFVPIGPGMFVKGTIENTEKVLMTIGANVAVVKPKKDAKEMVDRQILEMKDVITRVEEEMQNILMQARQIQEEMEALSKKQPQK